MKGFSLLRGKYRQRPDMFLALFAFALPLSFAAWRALLNNFAVDVAAFSGREMGILQSLRELPGFLAFGVVYLLMFMREQRLMLCAPLLLATGIALTGFFPSVIGLCLTTLVMSTGFHLHETMQTALAQQWIDKQRAPETFGRLLSISSFAGILSLGLVWLATNLWHVDYRWLYLLFGSMTLLLALFAAFYFPLFPQVVMQQKRLLLRRRYLLYYGLVFMSGARRQISTVFAGFLMLERFGYQVGDIALLFMLNAFLNVFLAPRIGKLIGRIGERRALLFEYSGLVLIFSAYALVDTAWLVALVFIGNQLFFAFAISIKTYFQKIAAAEDISATAGVSFTINHIAAVVIPALFGLLWLHSPSLVFWLGAGMALVSLGLALLVPRHPAPGCEICFRQRPAA